MFESAIAFRLTKNVSMLNSTLHENFAEAIFGEVRNRAFPIYHRQLTEHVNLAYAAACGMFREAIYLPAWALTATRG